jgi:hypothetical protein
MMRSEVKDALERNYKLVFVDETMFTTSTVLTHIFSSKKNNIEISQDLMNNEALAVVGGVSADGGLEGYLVEKGSINSDSFIRFLELLK